MSPRQVGSGFAVGEADATARLLAAHFARDSGGIRLAEGDFASAQSRRFQLGAGGGRGFSATQLSSLLARIPPALRLPVRVARACGPGQAGDVIVECARGRTVRIEIKAQLTLADFSWIQSADWIREETDFLGALLTKETAARDRLSRAVRDTILESYDADPRWNLAALWVADVAGVTSSRVRERVGLASPADLRAFLADKYLVHITMEGLRVFRMTEIPNLTSALEGGLRYVLMPPAAASELRVRTRGDGQLPRHGGIHLTYFLGQRNRPVGGHHMHAPFFDGATPLLSTGQPRGTRR